MDDEEEEGPSMGARPREIKQPNPLNQPRRDRQAQQVGGRQAKEGGREQADQGHEGQAEQRGRGRDRRQAQQGRGGQILGGQAQQGRGEQVEEGGREQADQGHGGQAEQRGRGRDRRQAQQGRGGQAQQGRGGQGEQRGRGQAQGLFYVARIQRDWTTSGLFCDPINQRDDTCGSVVFTHLLQASYNKDKPIAQHRDLSYLVLANHIQSQTNAKGFSFRNLNIPINYIRNVGLKSKRARGHGVTTTGHFEQRQDASRTLVFDTLERTPLGIVINNFFPFERVGMGIYHVPLALDDKTQEHALLVLARGITDDGVDFVVVQNSWGETFGNKGYCRLFLPADGIFKIFWPHFD